MGTVERGLLYRALRAVSLFAQEPGDVREWLQCVLIESFGERMVLAATYGHIVGQVTIPTPQGEPFACRIDRDDAWAMAKHVKPIKTTEEMLIDIGVFGSDLIVYGAPFALFKHGTDYPEYRDAIPPIRENATDVPNAIGIDPRYLGILAEACRRAEITGVTMQGPRDPHGVFRFDGDAGESLRITVALAAMRI